MSPHLFLVLAMALGAEPQQGVAVPAAVSQTETPPAAADGQPADLPVSLSRIQRSLSQTPRIRTAAERPVFRVEVFGRKATIEDILGSDYLIGPVAGGAPTHQEFLSIVTPTDVKGMSAFSNGQAFMVTATAIALQWAVLKAMHKYEEAKKERERDEARREVFDAVAALREARKKAGLPDK